MSITQLIDTLMERRIQVSLKDDQDLRVAFPQGEAVDPEMVHLLKANKQELIQYLKQVAHSASGIERAPHMAHYPVSNAQKSLWILQQMEPGMTAYNIPVVRKFSGAVDTQALQAAYQQLVARHESLRTCFLSVEGEPRQQIMESLDVTVASADLRQEADPEASAEKAVSEAFHQPFHLETGPLHRMCLWQTGEQEYTFLLVIHHIIADGWSIETLNRDLMHLYRQQLDATVGALPALPIQYKDYAVWLQKELSGAGLVKHKQHWMETMAGELPVLDLPLDHARLARQTFTGARIKHVLPAALKQQAVALGQAHGASTFVVLMAALKALFYRYSGQTDMILGTPTAGRNRAELEDQIGFFINTLAIRTQFEATTPFLGLVQQVNQQLVGAQDHQLYPFDQLVEDLKVKRDLSRSPLFDVLVSYHEAQMRQEEVQDIHGLQVEGHSLEMNIAQFDLLFDFNDWDEQLEISLMYNTDLYKEGRLRRMLQHFESLLAACLQEPSQAIGQVGFLTESQQAELLVGFNPDLQAAPEGATLVSMIEAQAEATPDAKALVAEGTQLSFAALNAQANQYAACLTEQYQVKPGDIVAVMLDRSVEMVLAVVGIMKAGATFLPLEPGIPEARKKAILEDSQAKALITHSAYMFDLAFYGGQLFIVDIQGDDLPAEANNPQQASPAAPAYVVYTSGSTGTPKGVTVPHRALAQYFSYVKSQYQLGASDAMALFTSYAFDLGYTSLFGPLVSGATLVLVKPMESLQRQEWIAALEAHQVSVLKLSPAHLHLLVDDPMAAVELSRLQIRTLILGGEAINIQDVSRFLALKPDTQIVDEYGPTESTIGCVAKTITSESLPEYLAAPSIGLPIAANQAVLLDAQGKLVPQGVPGELCIYGEGLATGYLNRPELTAEKFTTHPYLPDTPLYRTGDRALLNEQGEFVFMGRLDDQVKVRGFRIELGEIAQALQQHELIRQSLVLAQKTEDETRLVGYYESAAALEVSSLRQFLAERLPEYMIPELWVWMEAFPTTANGKIDKSQLPDAEVTQAVYEAPATATEQTLADIWKDVLQVPQVGRADNFFALGGHSLKGIQTASRIFNAFGVKIELRDLFGHPTVAELAPLVAAAQEVDQEALHAVEDQEDYPVSSAQERIWVVEQLQSGTALYNMPMAIEFQGKLNEPALAKAMRTLIDRHESLRTRFFDKDGAPRQAVVPAEAVDFALDTRDVADADEATLKAMVGEIQAQPIALDTPGLLRLVILRVAPEKSILVLVMHHIISDGWSLDILTQEMVLLYDAYIKAMDNPLEALPLQYRDYAVWQRQFLAGEGAAQQKAYWLKQFATPAPAIALPEDHERTATVSNQAAMVPVSLEAPALAALKQLAQEEEATLYMALLALWKMALHEVSGQHDIVVGSPTAGRNHDRMESMVGCFLNTLAMRSTFSPETTYRELLAQVKETTLAAFGNQDYPFDRLVSDLKVDRVPGRSPLFDVGFTLQNTVGQATSDAAAVQPDYTVSTFSAGIDIVKADWWLFAWEDEDGTLAGALAYKTDLYEAATLRKVADMFLRLCESVTTHADESLETIIKQVAKQRRSEAKKERKQRKKKNLDLFLKA